MKRTSRQVKMMGMARPSISAVVGDCSASVASLGEIGWAVVVSRVRARAYEDC